VMNERRFMEVSFTWAGWTRGGGRSATRAAGRGVRADGATR
jgi:hypothetical protein